MNVFQSTPPPSPPPPPPPPPPRLYPSFTIRCLYVLFLQYQYAPPIPQCAMIHCPDPAKIYLRVPHQICRYDTIYGDGDDDVNFEESLKFCLFEFFNSPYHHGPDHIFAVCKHFWVVLCQGEFFNLQYCNICKMSTIALSFPSVKTVCNCIWSKRSFYISHAFRLEKI